MSDIREAADTAREALATLRKIAAELDDATTALVAAAERADTLAEALREIAAGDVAEDVIPRESDYERRYYG